MNALNTVSVTFGRTRAVSRAELKLNAEMQADDYRIAKANKNFARANAAQKRILIAKDVLTWLAIGKLTPMRGVYITPKWYKNENGRLAANRSDLDGRVEEVQGRTVDDKVNGGRCAACALGGLFACAVERADGLKDLHIEERDEDGRGLWGFWRASQRHMHKYLEPFFSVGQLGLIETAFECSDFYTDLLVRALRESEGLDWDTSWDIVKEDGRLDAWKATADAAIDFNADVVSPAERMRRIMQNIIDNGGTFVPPQYEG